MTAEESEADNAHVPVGNADGPGVQSRSLEDVRAAVTSLLAAVGIGRVVVVDEDFEVSLADVISALESATDEIGPIENFGEIELSDERENWVTDVTEAWDRMSAAERAEASQVVLTATGAEVEAPEELEVLRHVLPDSVEAASLTPAQWLSQQGVIVEEAASTPTLVLFDRSMHDDEDAGLKLLTALYEADSDGVMWAGLLTNTATVSNELRVRTELAGLVGVQSERFVLLSKGHLNEDVLTFAEALRIALMSQPATLLLKEVASSITNKAQEAVQELLALSPPEFDRIVFGLSHDEGAWEVDMLLRLFDAHLRSDVRADLHASEAVREKTVLLRTLNGMAEEAKIPSSLEARKIHRRDLYDEGDHLSAISAPIELGDVFERDGGKFFIVVDQPCDLMVRNEGDRSPKLPFVTLLPVVSDSPSDPCTAFELQAFREGESSWVLLSRPSVVPCEALDFCVFDAAGRSVAPRAESGSKWQLPPWEARLVKLAKECDGLRAAISDGQTSQSDALTAIKAKYGVRSECIVKPRIVDSDNFEFPLRRVARLLPAHARALLTSFRAHQARDGFDRAIA